MANTSTQPQLPKPPKTWMTLLIGGLLIVSGMVMGAGGTILLVKDRVGEHRSDHGPAPDHLMRRIAEDLELTETQHDQIYSIVETHQKEMEVIRQSMKDEVDVCFDTLKTDIEAVLTPEQLTIWEERIKKFRKRGPRGPGREHHGPGRDGRRGPKDREYNEQGKNGEFDGRRGPRHDGRRDGRRGDHRRPPRDFREGEHPPPPPPPPSGDAPPPPPPE